MCRTIKEAWNLYIYVNAPLVAILFFLMFKHFGIILVDCYKLQQYGLEISLAIMGILFTVLGLFVALPDNRIINLMKKYGHFDIMYHTLSAGIFLSLISIILILSNIFQEYLVYICIAMICETAVATLRLYKTLNLIHGRKRKKT